MIFDKKIFYLILKKLNEQKDSLSENFGIIDDDIENFMITYFDNFYTNIDEVYEKLLDYYDEVLENFYQLTEKGNFLGIGIYDIDKNIDWSNFLVWLVDDFLFLERKYIRKFLEGKK